MKFCKQELAAVMLVGEAMPMAATGGSAEVLYPERPVTLVVGYPAGGGDDALARLLATYLKPDLGQKVLIENRPGAASNIAAESVARAPADGYPDVVSGRVDVFFSALPTVLPHISAGMVRPIAVMSRHRAVMIHTVPTINESGFHGLELDSWMGLMATAGAPAYAIERMNNAVNAALLNPTLQQEFMARDYVVPLRPNTPEGLKETVARETVQWASVLRERNIAPAN